LVAWKDGNVWQHEAIVDIMTDLIVRVDYNTQTALSGIPAKVMVCVKSTAINHVMFMSPFAVSAKKTILVNSWRYKEYDRIYLAPRNSNHPHVYISVAN